MGEVDAQRKGPGPILLFSQRRVMSRRDVVCGLSPREAPPGQAKHFGGSGSAAPDKLATSLDPSVEWIERGSRRAHSGYASSAILTSPAGVAASASVIEPTTKCPPDRHEKPTSFKCSVHRRRSGWLARHDLLNERTGILNRSPAFGFGSTDPTRRFSGAAAGRDQPKLPDRVRRRSPGPQSVGRACAKCSMLLQDPSRKAEKTACLRRPQKKRDRVGKSVEVAMCPAN